MSTHLIIGDAHDQPEISKARFLALGKLIADVKPDVVVCLGDFASMDSLSSYDKGKKSHEGKRYAKDVASANTALDLIHQGMGVYTKKVRKIITWGNHEDRIDRAVNSNAELDGSMSKDDIQFKQRGWETYEFLDMVPVEEVYYSHYFASGVMQRPIGGESPAASMLKKHYVSCVAGHSHLYDYAERTRADKRKINGLVAGCYYTHSMSYAKASEHMFWSGITILNDVNKGDYDLTRISTKRIMKAYN